MERQGGRSQDEQRKCPLNAHSPRVRFEDWGAFPGGSLELHVAGGNLPHLPGKHFVSGCALGHLTLGFSLFC